MKNNSHKTQFLNLLFASHVLKLGEFTLKSGRVSPYFFNFSHLDTGEIITKIGEFYAQTSQALDWPVDVFFGPAYKGIYLSVSAAMALSQSSGRSIGFASNRKEAKQHGEGGVLLGHALIHQNIVIVDDVITQGTAIKEVMSLLHGIEGLRIRGVLLAIDRCERMGNTQQTATQYLEEKYNIPVRSIVTLHDTLRWMEQRSDLKAFTPAVKRYIEENVIL